MPRRRDRRGFTLVEVLVALTIGSLLSITIMAAVSQQGRMAVLQGSREEAQQNVRAAIELLASELRSVPREGLIHAGANRIELRVPRAAGLLCNATMPPNGSIHMVVSRRAWSRSTADTLAAAVRYAPTTPDTTQAFVPAYAVRAQFEVTVRPSVVAPCAALSPSSGARMLTLRPVPNNAAYAADMRMAVGRADMYLYDVAEYTVGPSTVPGQWINRTSRGATRPLAGPLPPADPPGLRFRYWTNDEEVTTLPVTDPATLSTITRISIEVVTVSRPVSGGAGEVAPDSRRLVTEVYLRNNGGAG